VTALAVIGTKLYAGGGFSTAGGVPVNDIAQWDGTSWSALGSGVDGLVYAMTVSGTDLYVGGLFGHAGGVSASSIAKWDGSSWSALGSGANNAVMALAVSGASLYAGGAFLFAGNQVSAYVAKASLGQASTAPYIITTNSAFGFTNGQFGFDVSAAAGETLVILGSTNLVNWTPLQTNLLSSPLFYFIDPSAGTLTKRFYRAEAQ
jgi:hypothetical protein